MKKKKKGQLIDNKKMKKKKNSDEKNIDQKKIDKIIEFDKQN